MDKYLRFLRNLASSKNDHTSRARRRKMDRELKKLNQSEWNKDKDG